MDTNIIRFNRIKRQLVHLLNKASEFTPNLKDAINDFIKQDKVLAIVPVLKAELVVQKQRTMVLNELIELISSYEQDREDLDRE